jgi:tryptophanyl-tRNA synthetase
MLTVEDDEKALFKETLTFEDTHKFALQNAKDIIACGFDVKKTFIYSDLEYVKGHFLMNVWEFSKLITFNQVRGAFGFNKRLALFSTIFPQEPQSQERYILTLSALLFSSLITCFFSSFLDCTNTLQH